MDKEEKPTDEQEVQVQLHPKMYFVLGIVALLLLWVAYLWKTGSIDAQDIKRVFIIVACIAVVSLALRTLPFFAMRHNRFSDIVTGVPCAYDPAMNCNCFSHTDLQCKPFASVHDRRMDLPQSALTFQGR